MRSVVATTLLAVCLTASVQPVRAQVPGDNDITIRTECWNGSSWTYCPVGVTAQVAPAAPDASTITTGGTSVTAFASGHVAKGGWLYNPVSATSPLCVAIAGNAGVSTSAMTTCIAAGQTYTIPAMAGAVSVNAADSGHIFSGAGYQ